MAGVSSRAQTKAPVSKWEKRKVREGKARRKKKKKRLFFSRPNGDTILGVITSAVWSLTSRLQSGEGSVGEWLPLAFPINYRLGQSGWNRGPLVALSKLFSCLARRAGDSVRALEHVGGSPFHASGPLPPLGSLLPFCFLFSRCCHGCPLPASHARR